MKSKIISISLALVFFILLSTAASAAVVWNISPSTPTVGDTLVIKGTDLPGASIKTDVSFEKAVAVSGGKYRYLLENVKIPASNNNCFTVRANGVQNLHVGMKDIVWITKTAGASGGIATISQANIRSSTYSVLISGDALKGKSSVILKTTASQIQKADSKGNFEYTYDTSTMPAGKYTIIIGSSVKTIELIPKN
jgi:hypothetical protein